MGGWWKSGRKGSHRQCKTCGYKWSFANRFQCYNCGQWFPDVPVPSLQAPPAWPAPQKDADAQDNKEPKPGQGQASEESAKVQALRASVEQAKLALGVDSDIVRSLAA